MLSEKARFLQKLAIFIDFLLICTSYFVSKFIFRYNIRFNILRFDMSEVIIASGLILFCLYLNNVYSSMRRKTYRVIAKELTVAHVQAGTLILSFVFIFKVMETSRQLVLTYLLCSIFLVLLRRVATKFVLVRLRVKGYNLRNILIVGTALRGKKFARLLLNYRHLGHRVAGFLSHDENDIGKIVRWTGSKIVGSFDDLDSYLKDNPIDEVVFAVTDNNMSWKKMQEALLICEEYGVNISILPAFFNMRFSKLEVEEVGGQNVITFLTHNKRPLSSIIKQATDTLVSSILLLLLSPLMIGIAIAIKFDSPGPVLFVQERCGQNGRTFKFLKFRSMCIDAEERKRELFKYNEMSGPIFKMQHDPRVTKVGGWLRKYSLDELPQFINVFRGDMSLVGPRPPLPCEVKEYERWQRRRLSVKPGITCLWQVSGRNKIDFENWMHLDLKYIDNWSLKLDFYLLLRTLPAVVKGSGM